MPKVIYLNVPRVEIFTAKHGENGTMQLVPGRNVVPDEVFDNVSKASEAFRKAVDNEEVIVEGERVDVSKMNLQKAVDTIELETTIAGVEELLAQEKATQKPRKGVIEAAEAKIESLKAAEKEAEEAKKKAQNAGRHNA